MTNLEHKAPRKGKAEARPCTHSERHKMWHKSVNTTDVRLVVDNLIFTPMPCAPGKTCLSEGCDLRGRLQHEWEYRCAIEGLCDYLRRQFGGYDYNSQAWARQEIKWKLVGEEY